MKSRDRSWSTVRRACSLIALVFCGCVPATGTIIEVQGPANMTSTAAGIATLELVAAHLSYCDRWIEDTTASRTKVNVAGRDLGAHPYSFFIQPSHQTDLTQLAYLAVLAYSSTGQLLGEASFGEHGFTKDQVGQRVAPIEMFGAAERASGGPKYVSSDGCVCIPGQPWVGTGTGGGCDPLVITSFDRLSDTRGCELATIPPTLPVPACDGQQYPNEPVDRALPCWALDQSGGSGVCRVTMRTCSDHDGRAWRDECNVGGGDFMLPAGSTLCAKYLACEQTACGDVVGCFEKSLGAPIAVSCTLHIDPTTAMGKPIQPCPNTTWQTTLPQQTSTSCVAAVVQGVDQPPFVLGLTIAGQMAAQPVATDCPLGLQVDSIDAPYPMAIAGTQKVFDAVIGEKLARVTMSVLAECKTGESSLSCHL